MTLNDRIYSAFYVFKTNPNSLDAFSAPEQGALGYILLGQPYFWFEPAQPANKPYFHPVDPIEQLPHVVVLYAYQDSERDTWMVQHALDRGAQGIVLGESTCPHVTTGVSAGLRHSQLWSAVESRLYCSFECS